MSEIIKTEFGDLEYSVKGNGAPVLFFHGGHSNSEETLFHNGWDLSKYKIITPSRPGYGKTPLGNNTTPGQTAILTHKLIESLGIEKLIVVGISAGGLSAISFASEFTSKTCSLILISAVTKKWLDESDSLYQRGMKLFSPKMEKISWALFRTFFRLFPKRMTQTLYDELSTRTNQKITASEIEQVKKMTFRQSSGNGFVTDMNQDMDSESISKVVCPTLILHSENDKSVSKEMAFYADSKIRNSTIKTYNNKWGHLLWVGEEANMPISDLKDFLRENQC